MSLAQIAWKKRGDAKEALIRLGLSPTLAQAVSNRLPYMLAEKVTKEIDERLHN